MNLKIKDQELCFKISQKELNMLCSGQELRIGSTLGAVQFAVEIGFVEDEPPMPTMRVELNNHVIRLFVPREKLKELSDMGRSCAGLREECEDGSILILQVDVRSDSRKVKKR